MAVPREPRLARPLDAAALDRLALRYVERFATTRGKLADYLRRKMRERGLPAGYTEALETGLWPSCDVLPAAELAQRGAALPADRLLWAVG